MKPFATRKPAFKPVCRTEPRIKNKAGLITKYEKRLKNLEPAIFLVKMKIEACNMAIEHNQNKLAFLKKELHEYEEMLVSVKRDLGKFKTNGIPE